MLFHMCIEMKLNRFDFCRCKNVENYGSFSSLKAPGNSSSLSGKSNFRNNSNRNRTPFHKRYTNCCISLANGHKQDLLIYNEYRSESSLSKSKDRFSNRPPTSSNRNIRFVILLCFFYWLYFYHFFFDSGLRLSFAQTQRNLYIKKIYLV